MSIRYGKVTVKHLAPLRAPNAVMDEIEAELREKNLPTGAFILASVMKNMGWNAADTKAAVAEAYPPRWPKG